MQLEEFFAHNERLAVAFSGGVDSAYLLYAARRAGCDVRAYFVKSQLQPEFELRDARRLARELDVPLAVETLDLLADPDVASNPPQRCYHCKRRILTHLLSCAREDGYGLLCDGSNASDDADGRPGMRALRELGVASPLRAAGLTKAELRRLSREAGLFTHDKPSYACLATRVPTGTRLTAELLTRLEAAEAALSALGFTDFRVRYFHGAAKIELPQAQLAAALAAREKLLRTLGGSFGGVLLDLYPR